MERDRFLDTLGSSLVFLIDWNKARKALRAFMPKDQSVRILDWAARNHIGHRAFLELGGVELITTAVHNTAATRIGFGDKLDTVLGRGSAFDFFKNVLRICTDALKQSRSVRLARDRIEADLVRRLKRVDATVMAVVVRQAGSARESLPQSRLTSRIRRWPTERKRWLRNKRDGSRRRRTGSRSKSAPKFRISTRIAR